MLLYLKEEEELLIRTGQLVVDVEVEVAPSCSVRRMPAATVVLLTIELKGR